METPTITKSQKKSTLAGKKTKTKETIKNVVAAPYNSSYWPHVLPKDQETLVTVLESNLPRIKPNKVNVPWVKLKDIPRNERKKFRREFLKDEDTQIDKNESEGLTIGINEVSKLLEDGSAGIILLTADIQPRIMVRHVIDIAVLNRVPILVVEDLRNLLSKYCGISSAVMNISKNIDSSSKLNAIKESVTKIFEKYPPPLNHINYKRSLQNNNTSESAETSHHSQNDEDTNLSMVASQPVDDLSDDVEAGVYLKRDSTCKRVFVPQGHEKTTRIAQMDVDSTGFLPFSDTESKPRTNIDKANYRSLIVKRLKGDPNRTKKKIASLKRKLKK